MRRWVIGGPGTTRTRTLAAVSDITVKLPDGPIRSLPDGATAADLAARHRHPGWPRTPSSPWSTVSSRISTSRSTTGDRSPSSRPTVDRGTPHPSPLHRPRPGPGGTRTVARGHLRHRSAHRGRLLLRLRAAGRGHVQRRRPRRDRGQDARDREGQAAVRPHRDRHRRRRSNSWPPIPTSGRSSRPCRTSTRARSTTSWPVRPAATSSASTATPTRSSTCASAPTFPTPGTSATSS